MEVKVWGLRFGPLRATLAVSHPSWLKTLVGVSGVRLRSGT